MKKFEYAVVVGIDGRDLYVRETYSNLAEAKKGFTYICKKEKEEINSWNLGKNGKLIVELDKNIMNEYDENQFLEALDCKYITK